MDYDQIATQAGSFDTDSHECAKRAAKLAFGQALADYKPQYQIWNNWSSNTSFWEEASQVEYDRTNAEDRRIVFVPY